MTAECKDVAEMYNPEIWPVGSYVRRFYEPRRRTIDSGSKGPGGQTSGVSLVHCAEAN